MNYSMFLFLHAHLAFMILFFDRVSKIIALRDCVIEKKITSFFACALTFNRGISWGMLHDANNWVFVLVTVLVACVTAFIAYLTLTRLQKGLWSIGYVCVVAGSVSNLVDRVIYGAVVDFISFSYAEWHFPVFNIADVCIVGGIMMIIMVPQSTRDERKNNLF